MSLGWRKGCVAEKYINELLTNTSVLLASDLQADLDVCWVSVCNNIVIIRKRAEHGNSLMGTSSNKYNWVHWITVLNVHWFFEKRKKWQSDFQLNIYFISAGIQEESYKFTTMLWSNLLGEIVILKIAPGVKFIPTQNTKLF